MGEDKAWEGSRTFKEFDSSTQAVDTIPKEQSKIALDIKVLGTFVNLIAFHQPLHPMRARYNNSALSSHSF